MSHKNGSFSSSLGFVLACVGSAVGLEISGCSHTVLGNTEVRHFWCHTFFLLCCLA